MWPGDGKKISGNGQEMVQNGNKKNVIKWAKMARKCLEKMFRNCEEMVKNGQKWTGSGPRWSEMVQDGLKWYKKVQESPKLQNGQRSLKHWKKIHFELVRLERQRSEGQRHKRRNALPSSLLL